MRALLLAFLWLAACACVMALRRSSSISLRTRVWLWRLHSASPNTRLLYTIPTSLVSRQAIVAYVQNWASDSTNVGRAIRASATPQGVRFLFVPSPESHLDVTVDELGDDITLSTSVVIHGGNANVQSLIRFSAQSLVDSLANDVGTLIMTGGMHDGAKMALPRASGDVAQVIRQKVAQMAEPDRAATAADFSTMAIPSEREIMSMWTEEALPPKSVPIEPGSGNGIGSERVVYEWEDASDAAFDQVLQYVQSWSSRYANRGAGVLSEPRKDGSRFGFTIGSDAASLLVRVRRANGAVVVAAEAVAGGEDDEQTRLLVRKACDNIGSALQKSLAALLIMGAGEKEEEDDGSLNDGSLDDALHVVEAATARAAASRAPPSRPPERKRDPSVVARAAEAGVRLESFESRGLEEQAMRELQDMISENRRAGYLEFIRSATNSSEVASEVTGSADGLGAEQLVGLFKEGSQLSERAWQSMLERNYDFKEDLTAPPPTLPLDLKAGGLAGGLDIFQDPANYRNGGGGASLTEGYVPASSQAGRAQSEVGEMLPPRSQELEANTNTLKLLLSELARAPEEMHDSVLDGFKDLYLSDNFLYLIRAANETMMDGPTRQTFVKITKRATSVIADLGALVQQESVRHLETIHDICEISAQYQHNEAYFLERLSYIKPKFDTEFLGYLKWAIEEEKTVLRLGGGDPAALPSKWLQVLYVVQRGVIAEFEVRFERLLEPLILTVRFEDRGVRRNLLKEFVAITPAIELHTLRALALNMAAGIAGNVPAAEAGPEDEALRRKVLDLKDDLNECLSPDIIEQRMSEFREAASEQGEGLELGHRNPLKRNLAEQERELEAQQQLGRAARAAGKDSGRSGDPGAFLLGL